MVSGAPAQVQRRGGVVRGGLVMAAFRAAESADVVVVDVVIFHGGMAHRAAGPVVVHAGGGTRCRRGSGPGRTTSPCPVPGQSSWTGIVGVQDQLRLRMEGRENGVIHPLRMAVPGQLVPVEIGDDELRGVEVPEALGAYRSSDSISSTSGPHPARERRVGQHQRGDALDLVGAPLHCRPRFCPRPAGWRRSSPRWRFCRWSR